MSRVWSPVPSSSAVDDHEHSTGSASAVPGTCQVPLPVTWPDGVRTPTLRGTMRHLTRRLAAAVAVLCAALALPAAPAAAVTAPPIPAGVTAGIAVFDRQTGTFTEEYNVDLQFRSASVVKLLIALDYLWDRGPAYTIPAADRGPLDSMLRSSDDTAASTFWARGGYEQVVNRMVGRLQLGHTAPPPAAQRTFWGYTA